MLESVRAPLAHCITGQSPTQLLHVVCLFLGSVAAHDARTVAQQPQACAAAAAAGGGGEGVALRFDGTGQLRRLLDNFFLRAVRLRRRRQADCRARAESRRRCGSV